MLDLVDMNERYVNLHFKTEYDLARFVADFDNSIKDFVISGISLLIGDFSEQDRRSI